MTPRDVPLLNALDAAPLASSKQFCGTKHNHNVVVNIIMRSSFGLAEGIWSGTVLAAFLFHIGGNQFAGYAEAAMGMMSLIVGLPAGWLADRTSKAGIVRAAGLLVPAAVALSIFTVM